VIAQLVRLHEAGALTLAELCEARQRVLAAEAAEVRRRGGGDEAGWLPEAAGTAVQGAAWAAEEAGGLALRAGSLLAAPVAWAWGGASSASERAAAAARAATLRCAQLVVKAAERSGWLASCVTPRGGREAALAEAALGEAALAEAALGEAALAEAALGEAAGGDSGGGGAFQGGGLDGSTTRRDEALHSLCVALAAPPLAHMPPPAVLALLGTAPDGVAPPPSASSARPTGEGLFAWLARQAARSQLEV